MSFSKKRMLLLFPALAIGVAAFILLVKGKSPPQREVLAERVTAVRVIMAPQVAVVPRAVGYGIVQPGTYWNAISQVGGEVVEMHPDLDEGAIIPADELLFRIDPQEYGLATTRSEAELDNLRAQLRELDQRQKNLVATLQTERQALEIARMELQRKQQLLKRGTISASEVDQQQRQYLSQKNVVQELENSLALIPAEREALEARLQSGLTNLEDTKLDVGRTEIRSPFPLRIEEVSVELHQYAPAGTVLARAYDIEEAEIPAQMPLATLKGVISGDVEMVSFMHQFSMEKFRETLGLSAVVRMIFGDRSLEWEARFERIGEKIDPSTRTVPVYVVVDKPYEKAIPGERPPLFKNMYCQVELRGRPQAPRVVIPRSALHAGNRVYVANEQNRLEFRQVTPGYRLSGFVAIDAGLAPEERIVVSQLQPAVEGQLLAPEPDEQLRERLLRQATAEAPLQ